MRDKFRPDEMFIGCLCNGKNNLMKLLSEPYVFRAFSVCFLGGIRPYE